ncbi:MAG TPA: amino acid adenylation domain-containing protein, partial [Bacillota bacterium]|nr:amino acid adenylation domain-containing protein [Bacillota bacterium]
MTLDKLNLETPVADFLEELNRKNIQLWVEGVSLRYKAPKGEMTPEVMGFLKERKVELIQSLQVSSSGAPVETSEKARAIFYDPISTAPKETSASISVYPPSSAQKRMFVLTQLNPEQTGYNLTQVLKLVGLLQPERIEAVISQLIARHEILRTSFELVDGSLVQRIHPKLDFTVEFTEAINNDAEALIDQFIRPYDLKQPPLFRIRLVKLKSLKDTYLLLYDTHHIISDGISLGIFTKEINDLYAGRSLPSVQVQYKDFTLWHETLLKSEILQRQKEYWLRKFQGEIPVINLPADFRRPPVYQFDGGAVKQWIPPEKAVAINQLARKSQATLYQILFGAFFMLLARLTGQADLIVGTPTAGRRHADLYEVMGIFVNTLAIRAYSERSKRFQDFVVELSKELLTGFDNQDYPFETLVEELKLERDLSRNPLFDVMFILQNMRIDPVTAADLEISPYPFQRKIAQFDLTLTATENEKGIELELNYATQIFAARTAERFLEYYKKILAEVVQNPEVTIGAVELLSEDEKHLLIYDYNGTQSPYPQEKTFPQLFEEQVERTLAQPAVVFHDERLTYRELNIRANCLAGFLRNGGVVPGSLVGIMLERSTDLLAAILGVLKAGAAYVPMDPEYPAERLHYMVEDSRALMVLTQRSLAEKLHFQSENNGDPGGRKGEALVYLEELDLAAGDKVNPTRAHTARDLAYVIYTSGSTGKPKGVMVEHGVIHNFIHGITQKIEFPPEKKILGITTISFDIFGLETFIPLAKGLTIILADENEQRDPGSLVELLQKHEVDLIQTTPSRMQLLITSAPDLAWLKKVSALMIGGEAFPEKLLQQLTTLTGAKIYNMYGPTETTIWSTVGDLTQSATVNIGAPIANTQIYIVDQDLQLQPPGVAGELCIAGDGLARGYWERPELTAEKFVPNPFNHQRMNHAGDRAPQGTPLQMYRTGDLARWLPDGNIEFLGRIDHQVKIRGYRIELGEIESRLAKHEAVQEAVVVARTDENGGASGASVAGDKYLCAYLVSSREMTVSELREFLGQSLPEYMIPQLFVQLGQIPRTPNGKIDRRGLPKTGGNLNTGAVYEAPRNATEMKLVQIWRQILGVDQVGLLDNFFELGGHSLKAANLVARIHKEFNVEIPLRQVFQSQTVKEQAQYLSDAVLSIYSAIEPAPPQEYYPPGCYPAGYYPASAAQKRMYILNQLEGAGTSYNIPGVVKIEGSIERDRLESVFRQLVSRHESFRTSFTVIDGEPLQQIHPEVEFQIEYQDLADDGGMRKGHEGADSNPRVQSIIPQFIRPFDLSKAPLLRAVVIKLAENRHLLVYDMHHIISDGTSMWILIREFVKLYNGETLPELRIQYKDFAVWQYKLFDSEAMRRQEAYWLNTFRGEIPVLDLPTDYVRPTVQSFAGDRFGIVIDGVLTRKLNELATQTGSTLFMLLLAAYTTLLSKYTGQEDIIVGSPIAGRRHTDLENVIGMFVNTLALRNYPEAAKRFSDYLNEVRQNALAAYDKQDYQFEELVETLNLHRDMSRNPLFDTMFVLQNMEMGALEIPELKITPYEFENPIAKFDLMLTATETSGGINFELEYCTALFKRETIERLAGHFINLLERITENPELSLSAIDMLSDQERKQLLYEFNDTAAPYPKEKTIQKLFEEQAGRTPDHTAVIFEAEELTYRELNRKANQLAGDLRRHGVGPGMLVAIMMERSLQMVIGVLGILKAGGAYLPIDPEYPAERVAYMLNDSEAHLLLTHRSFAARTGFSGPIIDLEKTALPDGDDSNPDQPNQAGDLLYIIYTSGTTGQPKGVMLEHRNLVNLIHFEYQKTNLTFHKV